MIHWPRTPVTIDGQRYDLCWSLGAVAEAQQQFDRRGIEVNLLNGLPPLNLTYVRVLFPAALRKYHPRLDAEEARHLVTWEALFPVAVALRAAWQAAGPALDEKGKSRERAKNLPEKNGGELSIDQQWQQLWSLAAYDLRLTTDQFYDLTVGQMDALIRRRERDIAEREFLFGQLASCTVNFSMGAPKKPVEPKDFMPSEWRKQPAAAKVKRKSRQAAASEIRSLMDILMKGQAAVSKS